jgi:hypothetical protein
MSASRRWARCNFDGRPLSAGDEAQMRNFAATLEARKDDRSVQWIELADAAGEAGSYWRAWHCRQPPLRRAWRPVPGREEWTGPGPDGLLTRHIYEIELAPAGLGDDHGVQP